MHATGITCTPPWCTPNGLHMHTMWLLHTHYSTSTYTSHAHHMGLTRYVLSSFISDVCNPNPCEHGNCISQGTTYTCQCFAGFTGTNCDISKYMNCNFALVSYEHHVAITCTPYGFHMSLLHWISRSQL